MIKLKLMVGIAVLLGMATACNEEYKAFEEGEFVLHLNEPKTLVDGTVIELTEIEDSRCPEEVECVWEGRSNVTLVWKRSESYTLSLDNVDNKTKELDGFWITLMEVNPYPSTENENEEKTAKIRIEAD